MRKYLSFLLLILLVPAMKAQEKKFPLVLALGNEATALPFTVFYTTPFHPIFQVGTEFEYKNANRHTWYQTANIGYIYHNYLYQGVYLNTQLGYDYKFHFGLNLKALFGLGYLQTFTTQREYQFKNGTYVSENDWGDPHVMPMFSLGLGYRFNPEQTKSTEFFLIYNSWVEYPYSPGFIPVMTHAGLEMGVKFYIISKKNKQ